MTSPDYSPTSGIGRGPVTACGVRFDRSVRNAAQSASTKLGSGTIPQVFARKLRKYAG